MTKSLTLEDLDDQVRPHIYTQQYGAKSLIEGVRVIPFRQHTGEAGDFVELLRMAADCSCEGLPEFRIAQINWSRQSPRSIKAWHLHLKQDEVWYVPSESRLLIGLWDLRKESKTHGSTNRLVMGGANTSLLYIPRGVAHGAANLIDAFSPMMYFTNAFFNPKDPDEKRIPWDERGKDFWEAVRD